MTSRAVSNALKELARLSADQNSILHELLDAAEFDVEAIVLREKRLGELICHYGIIAFGEAKAERLYLMLPLAST